jgi:REP element-mobilizing transposase RayT
VDFDELRQGFSPTIQRKEEDHMTYWRLHYHLIWSTYNRESTLTLEHEKMFYGVLYKKSEELGLKIHAAGNMEDHAHVVASIPPKLAVADCVRHLKGASAFAINHMPGSDGQFKWQGGYGALTVGERSLETVMEYAAKQKEHHRENRLVEVYERIDEEE